MLNTPITRTLHYAVIFVFIVVVLLVVAAGHYAKSLMYTNRAAPQADHVSITTPLPMY